MSVELLIEMAWKSLACAGFVLLAIRLMWSRSAAEKSFVAHVGILSTVLLPVASFALPHLKWSAPPAVAEAYVAIVPATAPPPVAEPAAPSAPVVAAVAETSWSDLILLAYATPAFLLLMLTLLAVVRLHRLRDRADVLTDPRWLSALAAAQHRLGHKYGTALLTSAELSSPISWGIMRPIIIVDPKSAREVERAEAIIAHELAHVARLDWPALLLGRTAAALFWFNPLVWLLARQAHELSEQAADDAVLRSDVPSADYAEILVGAARNASVPMLLAANGVAPGRNSLGRRVLNILDPTRSRIPVRLGWSLVSLAGALGVGTALAAVEPKMPDAVIPAMPEPAPPGDVAAARLAEIPTPQTRAIARAIALQDWKVRRAEDGMRFDDRRAVEPLLLALRDPSPVTRRIAVWGLSELGAADQAGSIARLMRDPSREVRMEAAHALGDLRNPAAMPALEGALHDSDPDVAAKARWALREIEEAQAMRRRGDGG